MRQEKSKEPRMKERKKERRKKNEIKEGRGQKETKTKIQREIVIHTDREQDIDKYREADRHTNGQMDGQICSHRKVDNISFNWQRKTNFLLILILIIDILYSFSCLNASCKLGKKVLLGNRCIIDVYCFVDFFLAYKL